MEGMEAFRIDFSIMRIILKIFIYEFSIEMAPSLQMVSQRQVNILVFKVFLIWRHHLEALQKASKCLQIDSGRGY
jgi:hypothetical protein